MFLIGMCPPLIYITMDCIMRHVFSLRVFNQMDAHTAEPLCLKTLRFTWASVYACARVFLPASVSMAEPLCLET